MKHPKSNCYPTTRRRIAYISILGVNQLHLQNPYVIAWWTMSFPGAGHIILSKHLRGFLLFIWEVVVNYNSNLNLGLFYTFTGQFSFAKDVLNIDWLLLYIPTYVFAIWDSYRTAVDMNTNYILAAREDSYFSPFRIGTLEINYLDKRHPWISAVWSAFMPGTGQLYMDHIVSANFYFGLLDFIGLLFKTSSSYSLYINRLL